MTLKYKTSHTTNYKLIPNGIKKSITMMMMVPRIAKIMLTAALLFIMIALILKHDDIVNMMNALTGNKDFSQTECHLSATQKWNSTLFATLQHRYNVYSKNTMFIPTI